MEPGTQVYWHGWNEMHPATYGVVEEYDPEVKIPYILIICRGDRPFRVHVTRDEFDVLGVPS